VSFGNISIGNVCGGLVTMGYFYAILNYLKTDKARHDVVDYIRAAVIIAAVMAMVRVLIDIIR
jgi:hypothetical protein